MIKQLSEDSLAIMLLCSNLATGRLDNQNVKPYSLVEWNKLANLIVNSDLKSPKAFFRTDQSKWKAQLQLSDMEAERIELLLANGANLGIELNNLSSYGIWVTTRAEDSYPALLKNRLKHKCPVYLYGAGNASLLNTPGIAIVGSRETDENGVSFTQQLAMKAAQEGYTIVSGGARGVDSIAQQAALSAEGTVIAVIADGLEAKIRNRDIRLAIQKKQLLLLSPFHPKAGFKVYTAMERNKYIYALAKYAVAVSSDHNKGGTWSGAQENLHDRWVPLFVRQELGVPKGNEELIKAGGYPIRRDILLDPLVCIGDWMMKASEAKQVFQYDKQQALFDFVPQDVEPVTTVCKESAFPNDELNVPHTIPESIPSSTLASKADSIKDTDSSLRKAYDCVLPLLLDHLTEPKTTEELARLIEVKKTQAQDWIDKMVEEALIEKLSRPVRYARKPTGQI